MRGQPGEAGLVVVEVVLPGWETQLLAGGNVFGEVVEVECFGGVEVVCRYGFGVEVPVGFDCSDLVGKVVVVEEGEVRMLFEE